MVSKIYCYFGAYIPDLKMVLKRFRDSKRISSNFSSLYQVYMHQNSVYCLTNQVNFLLIQIKINNNQEIKKEN